jgi:hypothetical protein
MAITVVAARMGENHAGSHSNRQGPVREKMRSLETIVAMRFPVIPGLMAEGLRYLDNEFRNAAGLAAMFTQHRMLKGGAIALVLAVRGGAWPSDACRPHRHDDRRPHRDVRRCRLRPCPIPHRMSRQAAGGRVAAVSPHLRQPGICRYSRNP